MLKNTIFLDTDTQYDFMNPAGRLYIPGAEEMIPAVSQIRCFAAEHDLSILATVAWHTRWDEEIAEDPDYKETFPPHCIADSPGAARVGSLGSIPIDILDIHNLSPHKFKQVIAKQPFHMELRKNRLDIFTLPETGALLDWISPQTVIVFGVALDVCVFNNVRGLLNRNRESVVLLADAVKGLGKKSDDAVLDEIRLMGAYIMTFEDLKLELFHVASHR